MSDRSEQAFREAFAARAEALHPQPLLPLPERSRRRWPLMAAVAAAVVMICGSLVLWPSGEEAPTPADVTDDSITEPRMEIMDAAPAELPPWISESARLPVNDLAHVADVDDFKVFASRDDEGQWCVLLALEPTSDGSDWAVGSSCAPSQRFATDGISIEASSSGRWGGALLLPDNFGGKIGDEWERVNDNLAVRQ